MGAPSRIADLDVFPNHTPQQAQAVQELVYGWATTTPGVRVADVVTIHAALGFFDKGAA